MDGEKDPFMRPHSVRRLNRIQHLDHSSSVWRQHRPIVVRGRSRYIIVAAYAPIVVGLFVFLVLRRW